MPFIFFHLSWQVLLFLNEPWLYCHLFNCLHVMQLHRERKRPCTVQQSPFLANYSVIFVGISIIKMTERKKITKNEMEQHSFTGQTNKQANNRKNEKVEQEHLCSISIVWFVYFQRNILCYTVYKNQKTYTANRQLFQWALSTQLFNWQKVLFAVVVFFLFCECVLVQYHSFICPIYVFTVAMIIAKQRKFNRTYFCHRFFHFLLCPSVFASY